MLQTGTILEGRYRIDRLLGQGGMGAVYQATDLRLGKLCAVKQTTLNDPNAARYFEREARLLARLDHPNLPHVTDHFVAPGGQFLVMQFVAGDTLGDLLARHGGPLPQAQVLELADQLLEALSYLHGQQPPVIHRDIKPQNIKLTPGGRVMLLDFGISKTAEAAGATTALSIMAYTLHFAPLEQIQQSAPTDVRSDLYSLAATLYNLLTAQLPEDALARASAAITGAPDPLRPPSAHTPQLPRSLDAFVLRGLALDPARRYQSVAEMQAALRAVRGAVQRPAEQPVLAAGFVTGPPPATGPTLSPGGASSSQQAPIFQAVAGPAPQPVPIAPPAPRPAAAARERGTWIMAVLAILLALPQLVLNSTSRIVLLFYFVHFVLMAIYLGARLKFDRSLAAALAAAISSGFATTLSLTMLLGFEFSSPVALLNLLIQLVLLVLTTRLLARKGRAGAASARRTDSALVGAALAAAALALLSCLLPWEAYELSSSGAGMFSNPGKLMLLPGVLLFGSATLQRGTGGRALAVSGGALVFSVTLLFMLGTSVYSTPQPGLLLAFSAGLAILVLSMRIFLRHARPGASL